MSWIGDLERAFATSLYPNRVPVAIALCAGLAVLVVVARRRGWFGAARRYPARTGVLLAIALVLGLPVAWYLGSPLFIKTSLVEPAPVAVVPSERPPSEPTGPRGTPPSLAPTATTAGTSTAPPRSGAFKGMDDFHFGRGTAVLIEAAPGSWVVRFEDFSVRNGPDLYVYLSPDPKGYADGAVELGRLKATDGSFNTGIPAGTDVRHLESVVIWCKQFGVQFAVARLR